MAPATDDLLGQPLGELLEHLAADAPAPGAGAIGALTAAMAAGLVGMVAGGSPSWAGAAGAAAQADRLRRRLAPLAAANAKAYELALAALADPEGGAAGGSAIGDALARAAETPLQIAEAAADVALLGADAAEQGEPSLRPDAAAAAALAEAAARAACLLVEVNLTTTADDARVRAAHAAVRAASDGASRAAEVVRTGP